MTQTKQDDTIRFMPRRALVSLSDKSGLAEISAAFIKHQIEVISTGGTAKALREFGVLVRDVADVTNFPECLDGRVKTLHPKIHGGILARRDDAHHLATAEQLGMEAIDLVIISLYPFAQKRSAFEQIAHQHGAQSPEAQAAFLQVIDAIDIGGPSLIRGAAKNHDFVAVITDANQYKILIDALGQGGIRLAERRNFAASAFARTAAYDAQIASFCEEYLASNDQDTNTMPRYFALGGELAQSLSYGENPHQSGGLYRNGGGQYGVATAQKIQGKPLSYNNINDAELAWAVAVDLYQEFHRDKNCGHAAVLVKHATPCGAAIAENGAKSLQLAYDSDAQSAYGGVVAVTSLIDTDMADIIAKHFFEVVIAPDISDAAAQILSRRQNLRLLVAGGMPIQQNGADKKAEWELRSVQGGFLLQSRDHGRVALADTNCVTKRPPTESEKIDLRLAWRVVKYVRSNAIALAKNGQIIGLGGGQTSRVEAARHAIYAAGARAAGSVVASDAFFPFQDGLLLCLEAGITAAIQPGGSLRDSEVIACADQHDAAMVFTKMRHFRH